jgi:hypothetical protein
MNGPGAAAWLAIPIVLVCGLPGAEAWAQCRNEAAPLPVTLTVERARAIDDPEGCCGGDPELFVRVYVEGALTCTLGPRGSSFKLEGPLTCTFMIPAPYAPTSIRLELWDDDDGLGLADDPLDISRIAGGGLDFLYLPRCGGLTDDLEAGEIVDCPAGSIEDRCSADERTVEGDGDGGADRGAISFRLAPASVLSPVNGDLQLNRMEVVQVTPNPDAIVHDRPTMVRALVSSTYPMPVEVPVEADVWDELGFQYHDQRSVLVPPCATVNVDFFPAGWDGGASWGFRPQAGPVSPPARLNVLVRADPDHVIDLCGPPCVPSCRTANNDSRDESRPVKRMRDLSVLFQPVAQTDDCATDQSGVADDASDTRDGAAPYMRELIPAQSLTTEFTAEVLTLPDDDIVNSPHASLAVADFLGVLAEGFDRVVGVVKTGYFECHYVVDEWSDASGASLGDYGPRMVLAETQAGAVNSEVAAHELGHTFGLSEAPCPLAWPESIYNCEDEYQWCPDGAGGMCPATEGLSSRGFRLATGQSMDASDCLMGDSTPDGGGNPDDWLCDSDYDQLLRRLTIEPDPEVLWLRMAFGAGRDGHFYHDDAARLPQGVPDILSQIGGGSPDPGEDTTTLVFRDAANNVLDRVHFTPESVDTNGDRRDDAYTPPEADGPRPTVDMAVVVALPAGTAKVEMLRRGCVGGIGDECDGGAVQEALTDTLQVPAEAVDIELLHPVSSVLVRPGDLIPIEWRDLAPGLAAGPDAVGPRLSYVLVSPDNGLHWIPLAGRVTGHRYDWRARSNGRYLARVFSTNGFNTDDARGETDPDGDGCGTSRDPNPTSPDPDSEGDGVANACDNCPQAFNPVQQNADGDPYGDACDNCPLVSNTDQLDTDKDGHGNACDCAPTSGSTWERPTEVSGLRVARGPTPEAVQLSWSSLAEQAGTSIRYDDLTGYLGGLRSTGSFGGASCLNDDVTSPGASATQAWPPPATQYGYWYLARGQNGCGNGTYGDSGRTPDPRDPLDGSASPCP